MDKGSGSIERLEKALREVRCIPKHHPYILGVDGPPCPVCGSKQYE